MESRSASTSFVSGELDADGLPCQGVQVSLAAERGGPFSDSASVYRDAGRYYVRVSPAREMNFNVHVRTCRAQDFDCTEWSETAWSYKSNFYGLFRSDSAGLARIDVRVFPILERPVFEFQIRDLSCPNTGWSNPVRLTIRPETNPNIENLQSYMMNEPGDTFIYHSENLIANVAGRARIQIENDINFCGVMVRPWRFEKNVPNIYWNAGVDRALRWMVASPLDTHPFSNGWLWAYASKRYDYQNPNRARTDSAAADITAFNSGYFYGATSAGLPAYALMPKSSVLPYSLDPQITEYQLTVGPGKCDEVTRVPNDLTGTWRMRVERDVLPPIDVFNQDRFGGYASNPIIRVDYYEGSNLVDANGVRQFHRETWYWAEGVGPILIEGKSFNGFQDMCTDKHKPDCAHFCSDDSDCFADQMAHPHIRMSLVQPRIRANERLSIEVSTDGQSWSAATAVSRSAQTGYYLRAKTSATRREFTGYLETLSPDGRVRRWNNWLHRGTVYVPPTKILNLPPGSYGGQFRIWIPGTLEEGHSDEMPFIGVQASGSIRDFSEAITVQVVP